MTGWEYRTVKVQCRGVLGGRVDEREIDRILNMMGLDGWELVTAVANAVAYGQTQSLLYTFKRPLS